MKSWKLGKTTIFFISLIWFLVWGAFSSYGPGYILSPGFPKSAFTLFNGLRAYAPLFAILLSFILVTGKKSEIGFKLNKPLAFLFLYGLIGFLSSLLSPQGIHSAYWAVLFISVPITGWLLTSYGSSIEKTEILLQTNWLIAFLFVIYLTLGPLRPYIIGKVIPNIYIFPGKIGRVTQNGIGRYAGVASLIALSRIRQKESFRRGIIWFILFAISLNLLSVSQSRTALFGFAGGVAIILISFKFFWIAFFAPIFSYIVYLSGFLWAAHGTWELFFWLTRREIVWAKGLVVFFHSPLTGFGFHADRYLIGGHHMHNAFLHSLIQSGILGTIFFIAAIYGIWLVVIRNNLIRKSFDISKKENIYLSESLAILAFLTLRSFFESTAAFYGADLFFIVPVLIYIHIMGEIEVKKRIEKTSSNSGNNL
jgi:O-antigen ligase